jgi:hypothetical protein
MRKTIRILPRATFFFSLSIVLISILNGATSNAACDTGVSNAPCQPVGVRTIIVAKDDTGHYPTIQAALDASEPGDTIRVKSGVYEESLTFFKGGTQEKPLALVNYPGHTPVIAPAGATVPTVILGIEIHAEWIILDGFQITASWDGIRVYKGHNTLRNNWLYANYGEGILILSASDVVVENNAIDYSGSNGNDHGIGLYDDGCLGMSNLTVRKNVFAYLIGAAVHAYSPCPQLSEIRHSLIENNLLENNSSGMVFEAGFNHNVIRNNTIVHIAPSVTGASRHTILSFKGSLGNSVNNNLVHVGPSNSSVYPLEIHEMTADQAFDYNLWSIPPNTAWFWKGRLERDFNLNYKSTTQYDPNGVLAEAGFLDPNKGNYQVGSSSRARNAGTAENCAMEDKNGTLRPQESACDIGAYEFVGSPLDPSNLEANSGFGADLMRGLAERVGSEAVGPTVTITPMGGTFTNSVVVTLMTSTPGAKIYYTTDGTSPTESTILYTGPFTLTKSAIVKAKAFKKRTGDGIEANASFLIIGSSPFDFSLSNSGNQSVLAGAAVSILVGASVTSGTSQSVSFSASGLPSGSTVAFLPTSCNPGCSTTLSISTIVSVAAGTYPLTITGTGGGISRTTRFDLTVSPAPTVATPAIIPNGGTFADATLVTLQTSTSGASIYYTTDGTTPSQSSTLYNPGPFSLTNTTLVKAKAYKSGYNESAEASASFTIAVSQSYTLTGAPSSVQTGGTMTVSWTAPQGSSAKDWIGLYPTGVVNSAYGWWQYTNGAAIGSFSVTAPSTPGTYEFRYLLDDGYVDVKRSNSVSVTQAILSPPPPPSSPGFSLNDRVQTTTSVSIRATPSATGTVLGTQLLNKRGTIIGGPVSAEGLTWWHVDYDSGPDGWNGEGSLMKPIVSRFFRKHNTYYQKIPSSPKVDPRSANYVLDFVQMNQGKTVGFAFEEWSTPIWYARPDTPYVKVKTPVWVTDLGWDVVPIPPEAKPSGYDTTKNCPDDPWDGNSPCYRDSHMTVISVDRRYAWEFYQARRYADGSWFASLIRRHDLVNSDGILSPQDGLGSARSCDTLLSGILTYDELKRGYIDHALTFTFPIPEPKTSSWTLYPCEQPAGGFSGFPQRGDWVLNFGHRLQLDPSVDVNSLPLDGTGKIIAKALQEYGMILVEGSDSTNIFAEDVSFTPNSWESTFASSPLAGLPLDKFRVVESPRPPFAGFESEYQPVWVRTKQSTDIYFSPFDNLSNPRDTILAGGRGTIASLEDPLILKGVGWRFVQYDNGTISGDDHVFGWTRADHLEPAP